MIELEKIGKRIASLRKERGYTLNIYVNTQFIGACLESDRLKILTVKFQTPKGIFFSYSKECRGYYQGKDAYKAWIEGLSKESDFRLEHDKENVLRRLNVNDNMLCNLIDSRRTAASYLRENISLLKEKGQEYLEKIAGNCQTISDMLSAFRSKVYQSSACSISYNTINAFGVCTKELRKEQISLLEKALILEEESCKLAELILEMPEI